MIEYGKKLQTTSLVVHGKTEASNGVFKNLNLVLTESISDKLTFILEIQQTIVL